MPTAIVSTVFRCHHATAAAASPASSFRLPASIRATPGSTKISAGITIAVSIAAGTCLSARASSGGISRRAKPGDERQPRAVVERADGDDHDPERQRPGSSREYPVGERCRRTMPMAPAQIIDRCIGIGSSDDRGDAGGNDDDDRRPVAQQWREQSR